VPTLLDGSVLMAAVDSKEPEMAKEVLKCVRSSLSDDQVSRITTAMQIVIATISPGIMVSIFLFSELQGPRFRPKLQKQADVVP